MWRTTGAIFCVSRPATIIRSLCRGVPRKYSAPKRPMSRRGLSVCIISIEQQARPKVAGQMAEVWVQAMAFSTVVVSRPLLTSAVSGSRRSQSIWSSVRGARRMGAPGGGINAIRVPSSSRCMRARP